MLIMSSPLSMALPSLRYRDRHSPLTLRPRNIPVRAVLHRMPISHRRKGPPPALANSRRRIDLPGPGPGTASIRQTRRAAHGVPVGDSIRVPVVDDNTLTWMVAHPARLRGVNYRDGEVAPEMVLSGSCRRLAVIFWDNQMPVMSGLSLVKQFREAERNDFVVGMTGNALLSDQEEYIAAGVCRCPLYHDLCHFFLRLVCEDLDRGKT